MPNLMHNLCEKYLNKIKSQELKRFLVIGITSNFINFFVYYFFIFFDVNLSISSLAGYLAGVVCSYHFGRVWVFDYKFKVTPKSIILFILVYILGSIWMTGTINILVVNFGFDFKLSWIFGAGIAAVNNFIGMKFLAFQKNIP